MTDVGPLAGAVLVHAVTAFGIGGLIGGLVATWWQRRRLEPLPEPDASSDADDAMTSLDDPDAATLAPVGDDDRALDSRSVPIPSSEAAPARLVVLVSGAGTNLQALLDAAADPAYGATVVAVGADRDGIEGLARAERAGLPTFVHRVKDFTDRADWDRALTASVAEHRPDLVVSAGFMKLVGTAFLAEFGGRFVNTHPALSPAFPGMHGAADALAYGVKVTGCTVFFVDDGVDTGPIVAQAVVPGRGRRHLRSRCTSGSRSPSEHCSSTRSARWRAEGFTIEDRKVRLG